MRTEISGTSRLSLVAGFLLLGFSSQSCALDLTPMPPLPNETTSDPKEIGAEVAPPPLEDTPPVKDPRNEKKAPKDSDDKEKEKSEVKKKDQLGVKKDALSGEEIKPVPVNPFTLQSPGSPISREVREQLVLNRSPYAGQIFVAGSGLPSAGLDRTQRDGRLRSGKLTFLPSFQEELVYSDNFNGGIKDRQDSLQFVTQPGFGLDYRPDNNVSLNVDSAFINHHFTTGVMDDYDSAVANGSLEIKHFFLEALRFELGNYYAQVGNVVQSPLADERDVENLEILTGNRFHTNNTPVTLQYTTDRVSLRGDFRYDFLDYFNRDFKQDDYIHKEGYVEGAYDIFHKTLTVFHTTQFDKFSFANAANDNFENWNATAGIRSEFKSFKFTASGGYNDYVPSESTFKEGDALYGFEMRYEPSDRFFATVGANRIATCGPRTGLSVTDAYTGAVRIATNRESSLKLSHAYERRTRNGTEDVSQYSVERFDYHLGPRITTSQGFEFLDESPETGPQQTYTGLLEVAAQLNPRFSARTGFRYEYRARSEEKTHRTRRTLNANVDYAINRTVSIGCSFERNVQKDTRSLGDLVIDEAVLKIKLAW